MFDAFDTLLSCWPIKSMKNVHIWDGLTWMIAICEWNRKSNWRFHSFFQLLSQLKRRMNFDFVVESLKSAWLNYKDATNSDATTIRIIKMLLTRLPHARTSVQSLSLFLWLYYILINTNVILTYHNSHHISYGTVKWTPLCLCAHDQLKGNACIAYKWTPFVRCGRCCCKPSNNIANMRLWIQYSPDIQLLFWISTKKKLFATKKAD